MPVSVYASGAPPAVCANGHYFGPGTYFVSWLPCPDCPTPSGGHHRFECGVCGDIQWDPPHDESLPARMW
jgi:hypothetical protein